MALSGSIGNTFRTGYRIQIDWYATQSVENNTSTITANFYLISLGSSYTISSSTNKTVRINIDGTVYTSANQTAQLSGNQKKLMATAVHTVTHNADGTRTFTLGGEIDLNVTLSGVYYGTISIPTTEFTLDTIPRASTPTLSVSSVYYGQAVTIYTNRLSTSFTHTLRYDWNGNTGTIATGVGDSYTWTVPTSFIGYLSNVSSTTGTIYCDTYSGSTLVGTKSVTLTTVIPASTPSLSASSVNYGSSVTIYTNRVHSNLTHTLKYNWNGNTGTIATGVGANYAWTVPNSFMNYIPNSTSTTGTITVETYNGSAFVGSKTVNLTTTVPSSVVPTFDTITHSEANSVVANAGIGAYVKTLSKLNLAITGATGAYGSTITSYKIVFDGVTYNSQSVTSNTVTTAGTLTITGTVTDSRGRTCTKSVQITVLDYAPPTITSFTVKRCNSDGTLNDVGTYASITRAGTFSTLNNKNSVTIYVESSPRGAGTWATKHTATSTTGSFNETVVVGTYEITSSYDFRVKVVDKFYTVTATATMSTAIVTMSWGQSGVGIGKVWERGVLDIGGSVYIADSTTILNGKDLHLQASPGSTDSGDIIFEDGNGAELARLWQANGDLLVRFNGGSSSKIWHAGNDGINSGLDADLLDGYHASAILNNTAVATSLKSNLAVGWYTIAVVPGQGTTGSSRGIARFAIRDTAAARHQVVVFYATHMHGADASNQLTVLTQAVMSTNAPFKYIRIKENGTYDGAVLQVYISDATNQVQAFLLGDNFIHNYWMLKDWIPDATDPGDVANYSSMTERTKVDLTLTSRQGGIIVTSDIYAGGQTTQYKVWHEGNDGVGSGLDADTVDGKHASDFVQQDSTTKINLGSSNWSKNNGEGLVLGELYSSSNTQNARLMIYANGSSVANVYVDGIIYVKDGNYKVMSSMDGYSYPAIASTSRYSSSGAWATWDYPDFAAAPYVIHRDDDNLGTKVRNVTAASCELCMAGTNTGNVRAIAIGGV